MIDTVMKSNQVIKNLKTSSHRCTVVKIQLKWKWKTCVRCSLVTETWCETMTG